jgi:hypothetical protein
MPPGAKEPMETAPSRPVVCEGLVLGSGHLQITLRSVHRYRFDQQPVSFQPRRPRAVTANERFEFM